MFTETPLAELQAAAKAVQTALRLKYRPIVVRSESTAWTVANTTRASTVMLGDGAYWVVCLADAARLEQAGYEYAPR